MRCIFVGDRTGGLRSYLSMSLIVVDVEADGPIPGDYSMIALGAVVVQSDLKLSYLAHLKPISNNYKPEALAISGFSRAETLTFREPQEVMQEFMSWIRSVTEGRPIFVSDNNGFDWMFVCWYFHHFTGSNPFGYSSQNLGSLYKGLKQDLRANFKHLRRTRHSHNPVDDAIGNAEALLTMREQYGLQFRF